MSDQDRKQGEQNMGQHDMNDPNQKKQQGQSDSQNKPGQSDSQNKQGQSGQQGQHGQQGSQKSPQTEWDKDQGRKQA